MPQVGHAVFRLVMLTQGLAFCPQLSFIVIIIISGAAIRQRAIYGAAGWLAGFSWRG